MGSPKPETTHTVENRDPWAPAQPMLTQILGDAQTLYNSGAGKDVYQGDTTAGLGGTTQDAIGLLKQNAQPSAALQAGESFTAGLLNSGGMSGFTADALAKLGGIGTADLSALKSAAGAFTEDPSAASSYLTGVARGDYLDPAQANPYLDDLISQGATDAANKVAAQFSVGGRYGSGSMGAAIARETGKIATQTRAQQYDTERDRQVQAVGLLDSTDLARKQAALSGQSAVVGADQANLAAQTGRATTAAQAGQNASTLAAGLIPQLDTLNKIRSDNANSLLVAGSLEDAAVQAELDAQKARWTDEQDAPFRSLGLYQSIAQPIGGMGYQGESTTTKTGGGPSLGQQLLGGGLGLLSILGKGGVFSDERVKEDIKPVGELPSGLGLYSYKLDDALGGERQVGLLAQEVEQVHPEAVSIDPATGLKKVDYAAATDDGAGPVMTAPIGLLAGKGTKTRPAPPHQLPTKRAA